MAPPASNLPFQSVCCVTRRRPYDSHSLSYPKKVTVCCKKFPILPRFAFPPSPDAERRLLELPSSSQTNLKATLRPHAARAVNVVNAEVTVILSPFPWQFLCECGRQYRTMLQTCSPEEAKRAVEVLAAQPLPPPGKPLAAPFGGRWLACPWDMPGYEFADTNPATLLPVFPENDLLLTLLSSLLLERHVVVYGPTFQAVTSVMMQCLALLAPLNWQHIFVPVVPGPSLRC